MSETVITTPPVTTNPPPPVNSHITQPPAEKHWTSTYEGLPDPLRSSPALQPFKSPIDAIKAYVDVQPLIGRDKAPIPSDWNDKEQVKAFNAKLGVPAEAKEYNLGKVLTEKLPKGTEFDAKRVEFFETIAHENGLTPRQAAALVEKYTMHEQETLNQLRQSSEVERGNLLNKFKQERGTSFDTDVVFAHKALVNYGGPEILALLNSTGLGDHPEMIKLFAKVGQTLKEGEAHTSGSAPGTLQSNTPDAARVRLAEMKADPNFIKALNEVNHPNHKNAVAEWTKLHGMLPPRGK